MDANFWIHGNLEVIGRGTCSAYARGKTSANKADKRTVGSIMSSDQTASVEDEGADDTLLQCGVLRFTKLASHVSMMDKSWCLERCTRRAKSNCHAV
jgi:hypothetical protein